MVTETLFDLLSLRSAPELQSVFVGGKGGVGKTTCSCSIAAQLSLLHPDKKVLLISTDPAHNISDAFAQQFSGKPERINLISRDNSLNGGLWACEVDPTKAMQEELSFFDYSEEEKNAKKLNPDLKLNSEEVNFVDELKGFVVNLPGIDEAMALSSVLNYFKLSGQKNKNDNFDLIVFDTAPTGHTLRLLQLPSVLKAGLEKLQSWKAKFASYFANLTSLFDSTKKNEADRLKLLEKRMEVWLEAVSKLSDMFKDYKRTQFICVCNASFLSVYETKRLISELQVAKIHCEYVIVNMLLPNSLSQLKGNPGFLDNLQKVLKNSAMDDILVEAITDAVDLCGGLGKMQQHYLKILQDEKDIRLVLLPMLGGEVRGPKSLIGFSERLLNVEPKLIPNKTAAEMAKKFSVIDLEIIQNSEYKVDTKSRLMNKELFKESQAKSPSTEPVPNSINMDHVTPEMLALVPKMIMQPGGIQTMLSHPLVKEMKKGNDDEIKQFFKDIETNGLFAGLKYLSNQNVMNKLAVVAKQMHTEQLKAQASMKAEMD